MNIIITGSSGFVASELIKQLLEDENNNLYLITRKPKLLKTKYFNYSKRVFCYVLDEFIAAGYNGKRFDCLIHLAFARSNNKEELDSSLEYTKNILLFSKTINLKKYINISSQSVYGTQHKTLWKEELSPEPESKYAIAKYEEEKLTSNLLTTTKINYTNIRLSSVNEKARFINVFVNDVINNKPIELIGEGLQKVSLIDVRDVALALNKLMRNENKIEYKNIYNLGTGIQTSIMDIAKLVNKIGKEKYGYASIELINVSGESKPNIGMDNSLFCNEFNWKPIYGIEDMIDDTFEKIIK